MLKQDGFSYITKDNNQFLNDDFQINACKTSTRLLRVAALYRVSTKKQVGLAFENGQIKDDIPLQRRACREFSQNQGWVIVGEYEEKGVSGYKVSAQNRDAIQDLKESALRKEFDILLVFLFDRLGRIESETPFIVQWFVYVKILNNFNIV